MRTVLGVAYFILWAIPVGIVIVVAILDAAAAIFSFAEKLYWRIKTARPGIEPRPSDPKSDVLPLDDRAI